MHLIIDGYSNSKEILQDEQFPANWLENYPPKINITKISPPYVVREVFARLSVLQLDTHADLHDEYPGTKYSHACVMRRIYELCPIIQVGGF